MPPATYPRTTSRPRSTRPGAERRPTCRFSEVSHVPPPSPARPPPCPTASRAASRTAGPNKRTSSTPSNSPSTRRRPSPPRAGEGPSCPAQGPRRAQIAGHPHRRRVRRSEGEDPGVLSIGPETARPSLPGSAIIVIAGLAVAVYTVRRLRTEERVNTLPSGVHPFGAHRRCIERRSSDRQPIKGSDASRRWYPTSQSPRVRRAARRHAEPA